MFHVVQNDSMNKMWLEVDLEELIFVWKIGKNFPKRKQYEKWFFKDVLETHLVGS